MGKQLEFEKDDGWEKRKRNPPLESSPFSLGSGEGWVTALPRFLESEVAKVLPGSRVVLDGRAESAYLNHPNQPKKARIDRSFRFFFAP